MHSNYIEDHKALGYEALIDTTCGKSLALITDSTVLFVKNVRLNGKRKIIVIIGGISTPSTLKLHSNSRKFCQLDFQ